MTRANKWNDSFSEFHNSDIAASFKCRTFAWHSGTSKTSRLSWPIRGCSGVSWAWPTLWPFSIRDGSVHLRVQLLWIGDHHAKNRCVLRQMLLGCMVKKKNFSGILACNTKEVSKNLSRTIYLLLRWEYRSRQKKREMPSGWCWWTACRLLSNKRHCCNPRSARTDSETPLPALRMPD